MARILVVGSGIVGQATGRGFLSRDSSHEVTFLDINVSVLHQLEREGFKTILINGQVRTYPKVDFIMVCISTPPRDNGPVNLDYITEGMKTVGGIISNQPNWPVVVVRSTVPPWTTERVLLPLIEKHSGGKERGRDFGVCMNPEFLRAKSSVEDFAHPWATIIGELDQKAGDALEEIYRPFGGKLFRMRLEEAEFLKYVNNLRNAVVISFYNELWYFACSLGINDPNRLLAISTHTAESAWNPKYGSRGGFPYGGTCLPKDTHALYALAKSMKIDLPLLGSVIKVNDLMQSLAEQGKIPCAQIAGHNWQPSPALAE